MTGSFLKLIQSILIIQTNYWKYFEWFHLIIFVNICCNLERYYLIKITRTSLLFDDNSIRHAKLVRQVKRLWSFPYFMTASFYVVLLNAFRRSNHTGRWEIYFVVSKYNTDQNKTYGAYCIVCSERISDCPPFMCNKIFLKKIF